MPDAAKKPGAVDLKADGKGLAASACAELDQANGTPAPTPAIAF
jgi:hypothetical protein